MLSVVVPTFNEGKNIRNLVTQINDALKGIDYEILFVDDSKDNTPEVIMEVAKDFPQIRMEHRTGEQLFFVALNLQRVIIWLVWMLICSIHQLYLNICIRLWKVEQISVYQAVLYQVEMMVDLTGTESSYLEQLER